MASVQAPSQGIPRRKPRFRARPLPVLIGLAVLAVVGWLGWTKTHPTDATSDKLITAKVTKGDLVESVSATGSVTAQTGAMVKIGSQITGRIKRLYADVGSQVKAGQIIAELDLPDVQAQLDQARANLQAAQTRLAQQQSGVGMVRTQTSQAIAQAQAQVRSAQSKLASARAAAKLQYAQTPTDIKRAQAALDAAKAALSTARSNQRQVEAGAQLQIQTAEASVTQAKATAANAATNLKRNKELFDQQFVAASTVDDARTANDVAQAQLQSAQHNVNLVTQKVAADRQSARDAVTQAQQNVESAQAALEAAKAGTYQNSVKTAEVGDAEAAVRQAQAALQTAMGNTSQDVLKQQDIQQAQEAVKAAQAQVDFNTAQVAKTYIRSPISGTVLQLAAQQGETLAAGLSAPTLIIVADLDRLQVDVFVDETDIGKVRIGQDAEVTVDAFPKRPFRGQVEKIASGSTIQQGVVTYDVTVSINDRQHRLKPDMTASVTIQTGQRQGVLLVPAEAIKIGRGGGTVQVVVNKDGHNTVETRQVRTGASDGVNTEIRDGLKEGDTVVLAGGEEGNGQRRGFGPQNPFGPQNNRRSSGGGGRGGGGGRRGG